LGSGLLNSAESLGLAGFLVVGVLALPLAVLAHFDAFAIVDLVLHRDVVAALAAFTGECDGDALVVFCHGESVLKVLCAYQKIRGIWGQSPRRRGYLGAEPPEGLLEDLDDAASANSTPTLTDSKLQALFHSNRLTQLNNH
jgi:hypothetical protein